MKHVKLGFRTPRLLSLLSTAAFVLLSANSALAQGGVAVAKSFSSPSNIFIGGEPAIDLNQTSTLTITLSNPNGTVATLSSAFTDTLPAGLTTIAGTAATTCGNPTLTQTSTTVSLATGATIPANGSCTVSVVVIGSARGTFTNTIAVGALATSNGSNTLAASATLVIVFFPSVSKSFNPSMVGVNTNSVLTITLFNQNPNAATLTANFVDVLPSGLVITSPATTCAGGSGVSVVGTTVTLGSGAVIPANSSCTITANVSSPTLGFFSNTIAAGTLVTTLGVNLAPANASLSVVAVGISKGFTPSSISVCDTTQLSITLSNPFSTAATGAAFIDVLPAHLETCGHLVNTCGGVVTLHRDSISLSGGTIPASGTCSITLEVRAEECGTFTNNIPVNALTTSLGSNLVGTSATLRVFERDCRDHDGDHDRDGDDGMSSL